MFIKIKKIFIVAFKFGLSFLILSAAIIFLYNWINPTYSAIIMRNQVQSFLNGDAEIIQVRWADYDEVSKSLPIAMVASEDQNFPHHFGFDFKQIEKAWKDNKRGKRVRGASTITQQVAKNLFLWEGKSFVRKGIEAYFTVMIELLWSKKRVLEVYMNIAEMGEMIFGVGTAAPYFFNRLPIKLNSSQAALLAAVLPNPKKYKANRPSGYLLGRRNWILGQMNSLGGHRYLKDL